MVGTGGVYCRLGVVRELAWPLRSAPESRTDLHEELRFYIIRGVNVNVHTRVVLSLTPLVMVAPPE